MIIKLNDAKERANKWLVINNKGNFCVDEHLEGRDLFIFGCNSIEYSNNNNILLSMGYHPLPLGLDKKTGEIFPCSHRTDELGINPKSRGINDKVITLLKTIDGKS